VGLILDTSFVVAAEREGRRGLNGAADAFLAVRAGETFAITFTVAGELACGKSASDLQYWRRLCRPYPVLPWTKDVAWKYGEIYRELQSTGRLIGANDMWIAATAIVNGMGVVTRNASEFQRVAGLAVLTF
jgi:tRNA(fMet)-specific endonuclease VapC